jgi:protein SCO1/2
MSVLNRHAFPALLGLALCCAVLTLWACTPRHLSEPLNGAALEPPVQLQRLALTRSDGGTFTTADTRGRLSLFFFGYTNCPDVCPLTLAELTRMRRDLVADAQNVDVYFITLDPARDTPERMRAYLDNFPGVTGLSGSDAELTEIESAFNIRSERRDTGSGNYSLDHTAATYLVNAASQIQLAYPYGTPAEDITSDLHQLLHNL